jgi:hypothetical protein
MGIAVGDGIHRPLMRLINRLEAVGTVLMAAVQRIRRRRAAGDAADDAPPRHDVDRAWDHLGETIRWMRVLLVRFTGNFLAEKAALMGTKAAATVAPGPVAAWAGPTEAASGMERGLRAPDLDRAIRRKSIAQILERVCADLGTVATLLGDSEAAREVMAVAEALRALLDGVVEGVAAVVSQAVSGFGASAPGPAMLPGGTGPVRAPDSG